MGVEKIVTHWFPQRLSPFAAIVANEGLVRDPLLKKCNIPGGD